MDYHLKLSKAIELVWACCLTDQAKLKWFSTRLSPIWSHPWSYKGPGLHLCVMGFGASTCNCPVKDLWYYHRYHTEHPDLRRGKRRLLIPIKDNNAGKELSAATISRWICTVIVDSHAACENSKTISVKAHKVRAVATSLQLFNKVDLQMVMKTGRWSSGGTFTSFYLRDLCPQVDTLRESGPLVAAEWSLSHLARWVSYHIYCLHCGLFGGPWCPLGGGGRGGPEVPPAGNLVSTCFFCGYT